MDIYEIKKWSYRLLAIDFLKFVFSIIIVLVYANESVLAGTGHTIFPSGYIAVEFLFLVSEYMMAASHEKTILTSTLSYVRSKFLKGMPNFYVAWIISFTFFHILDPNMAMNSILVDEIKALPELLFISKGGYTGPQSIWWAYGIYQRCS